MSTTYWACRTIGDAVSCGPTSTGEIVVGVLVFCIVFATLVLTIMLREMMQMTRP